MLRGHQASTTRRLNGHYQSGEGGTGENLVIWTALEDNPLQITSSTSAPYTSQIARNINLWNDEFFKLRKPGTYKLRWYLVVDYGDHAKGNRNFRLSAAMQYSEHDTMWGQRAPRISSGGAVYYLPGENYTQQPTYIRYGAYSDGITPEFCTPYRSSPHSFVYDDDSTTPELLFTISHGKPWIDGNANRYNNPPISIMMICDANNYPINVTGRIYFERVS